MFLQIVSDLGIEHEKGGIDFGFAQGDQAPVSGFP